MTEDLVIPQEVSLLISPGALIRVGASVTLTIRGFFSHGPFQVFGPIDGVFGSVLFGQDATASVYPEWWGAVGMSDTVDCSEAIHQAIRAALNTRVARGLPTLVLSLQSSYSIERPIFISSESGPNSSDVGLLVQGSYGGSLARREHASLRCSSKFVGDAILTIQEVSGCTFENVSFDAMGRAQRCVRIEGTSTGKGSGVTNELFRVCAFRGGSVELVTAGLPLDVDRLLGAALSVYVLSWLLARAPSALSSTPSLETFVGQALETLRYSQDAFNVSGLTFDSCQFTHEALLDSGPSSGVSLWGDRTQGVQFAHCVFEGASRSFIHAYSSSFLVSGATFGNSYLRSVEQGDPTEGADIVLSSFGSSEVSSCTAVHCDSRSGQFLATIERSSSGGSTTLIHVEHRPALADRVSVRWAVGGSGVSPFLSMIACRFDGAILLDADGDRATWVGGPPDLLRIHGLDSLQRLRLGS